MKYVISKDWTAEERLVLMARVASIIQSDIPAGRYGAVTKTDSRTGLPIDFRPNCQTIIELAFAPRELLECSREDLQKLLEDDSLSDFGSLESELEKLWSGVEQ